MTIAVEHIDKFITRRDEEIIAKFGYIRLEEFDQAHERQWCEAPRHYYDARTAIAVVAIDGPGLSAPYVFPVCGICVHEFVADLLSDGENATLETCYIGHRTPLTSEECAA